MKALRIEWSEMEAGEGWRPDGYSFHTTPEAAKEYLSEIYNNLPENVPDGYDYPSAGWREPAKATVVDVPEGSKIAMALTQGDTVRAFRVFGSGELADIYRESSYAKATDEVIEIDYGQTPYTAEEIAATEQLRAEVEQAVSLIQYASRRVLRDVDGADGPPYM